jgi:hypothetical protein
LSEIRRRGVGEGLARETDSWKPAAGFEEGSGGRRRNLIWPEAVVKYVGDQGEWTEWLASHEGGENLARGKYRGVLRGALRCEVVALVRRC